MAQFTIYVPFHIEALTERVARAKLENALGRVLTIPCNDHEGPCDCVTDDPRVIASAWDIPIPASALGIDPC